MGHSFQIVGQSAENFHDADLIAITGLMIDEMQQAPGKYPQMEKMTNLWIQVLDGYGPGVIDMSLELVASSQESKSCFDRLLSAIEAKVKSFGEVVPASLLNKLCSATGVIFIEYQSSFMKDAIDKLRRLVHSS